MCGAGTSPEGSASLDCIRYRLVQRFSQGAHRRGHSNAPRSPSELTWKMRTFAVGRVTDASPSEPTRRFEARLASSPPPRHSKRLGVKTGMVLNSFTRPGVGLEWFTASGIDKLTSFDLEPNAPPSRPSSHSPLTHHHHLRIQPCSHSLVLPSTPHPLSYTLPSALWPTQPPSNPLPLLPSSTRHPRLSMPPFSSRSCPSTPTLSS